MREEIFEIAGLRAVSVGELDSAKIVVVLLHGFQMEPGDLTLFAHSLALPVWWVFPEGPLDAEPRGRAWWHIDAKLRERALAQGPRDFAEQSPPDLPVARDYFSKLLDEIQLRAGERPVLVGGFSQGGMLSCDALARVPRDIAGLVLLSTCRIAVREWPPLHFPGLPVFISHGRVDADLALSAGEALRDVFARAESAVTWVPFDTGHEIPLVVWRALRKWLSVHFLNKH